MSRELSIAELAAMAGEQEDQSVVNTGGDFEREVPEAGPAVGRLVEYIELGKHAQKPYQGKEKPPAEKVRLTFELLSKKHIKEYEVEGGTKKRGATITVTLKKSLSDKAGFKKLWNAMTYGRDSIKHMAQMLGEAFVITVYHNVVKGDDGKEVTYANLSKDGAWGIGAPVYYDAIEEVTKPAPVPEALAPIRLFLFANPTKGTWDSLFIDGTSERKNTDGTTTQVSKNWMQELILSAVNFKGSSLDVLLHGVEGLSVEEPEDKPAEKVAEKPAEKQAEKPAEQEKPKEAAKPKADASADALAALGL